MVYVSQTLTLELSLNWTIFQIQKRHWIFARSSILLLKKNKEMMKNQPMLKWSKWSSAKFWIPMKYLRNKKKNEWNIQMCLPNPSTWPGCFQKVNFLQVCIQSFPSPRPVAIPRIKSSVFPTIYKWYSYKYMYIAPINNNKEFSHKSFL